MAYCPSCGREQRCGCDKCHICGVEVVERRVEPTRGWMRAEARATGKAARRSSVGVRVGEPAPPARDDGRPGEEARAASPLPAVLFLLGCGILLVTLIEAVNSALHFPAVGGAASLADAMRRLGYYIGTLLYAASVRTMTGFGLVSLGLYLEPGRPFADREVTRKMTRAVGLVMAAVGSMCLLAALLVVLPVGSASLLIRSLLPAKWAAVSSLLAMGAALLSGGYLLVARSPVSLPSSGSERGAPETVRRGIKARELVNAGGDADESYRGDRGRKLEGGLSGRTGPEPPGPAPAAEQRGKAE